MKFATLGADPLLIPLVEAALRGGHDITWIGEADVLDAQLRALAPRAARGNDWQALIGQGIADAVFVGAAGDDESAADARAEQLRVLVQAGAPLLVVHPVCPSMLVYIELEMVRQDTGGVLRHYVPGRHNAWLDWLVQQSAAGEASEFDGIEQLIFERTAADRTKPRVLAQFARDADLIAAVCGPIEKVGALGTPGDDAAYSNLAVQLTSKSGLSARWSIGPIDQIAGGQLTLVGRRARASLVLAENGPVTLEVSPELEPPPTGIDADDAVETIRQFVSAIESSDDGHANNGADFAAAVHSMELADAVERSLERGRTITLYFEEHSEHSNFKGIMSALGCGLLIAALLLLPLAGLLGLLGNALGIPVALVRLWPWLLLIAFTTFLLLQILPKIVFHDDNNP